MGQLIVLALRIFVPLGIFRSPLAFGVIAMLLDGVDVILVDAINLSGVRIPAIEGFYEGHYHFLDKYLDMYYLTLELVVSLRWRELLARWTSVALFAWRAAGFALFELTGARIVLFFAPNMFENFFLFYLIARRVKPGWEVRTLKRLAIALVLLYIPKFGQEYLLHVREAQPWEWFKATFL